MMVKLKVREDKQYVGKTMYLNPLHVTIIKENIGETCYLKVIGIEKWLGIFESADVVACKIGNALEDKK